MPRVISAKIIKTEIAKEDLRKYTDSELSLRFANEESLYKQIRRIKSKRDALNLANKYFTFTQAQEDEFLQDFDDGAFESVKIEAFRKQLQKRINEQVDKKTLQSIISKLKEQGVSDLSDDSIEKALKGTVLSANLIKLAKQAVKSKELTMSMLKDSRNRTSAFKERFHPRDELLSGVTGQELIDTVQSNEPVINERVITKVWEEILKERLSDARFDLKRNMKEILALATG